MLETLNSRQQQRLFILQLDQLVRAGQSINSYKYCYSKIELGKKWIK